MKLSLRELIKRVGRTPTERKFYCTISPRQVVDANFSADIFIPEKSYFEIRLAEMFMRDTREYLRQFIPFQVALSEFIYDGAIRAIPSFTGSNLLNKIEQYVKDQYVEYLNTKIVGPMPYMGGDLLLFVGLYRVEVSNLLKHLFDILENITGAFDCSQLSRHLQIAELCSAGIAAILGVKPIEYRLGTADVFTDLDGDHKQFRSGYLAYLNCPQGHINPEELWVQDRGLFYGKEKKSIQPFRTCDYCLVKIDRRSSRNDYTTFPFHDLWKEARALIWNGKIEEAAVRMAALEQQMAVCPDLITSHRHDLVLAYRANFASEQECFEKTSSRGAAPATRAARSGEAGIDGRSTIEKIAYAAVRAGFSTSIEDSLLIMTENWERIPYLSNRSADFELTDDKLSEQIGQIEFLKGPIASDPKLLADAIGVASMF